jgi:hypothetical protein
MKGRGKMPKVSEKKNKTEKVKAATKPAAKKPAKKAARKPAKPKTTKLEKQRKEIRDALINALKQKGADTAFFLDQVDKYMDLWDMYVLLAKDVKENGLRYPTISPSGAEIIKDNPSVKNLPAYNKQMIMQLKMMDLLDFRNMAIPEDIDEL